MPSEESLHAPNDAFVPDRSVPDLHVRPDAADHGDTTAVRYGVVLPRILCHQHGDVRYDRRIAAGLFQGGSVSTQATARASFVDRHCVRDRGGDLDAVDDLHGSAVRSDLGHRGVALAQADPDHPAALCVCRHGDLARPHPKPLAGRHRLLRGSARRGGRLPARAWIAHMDGWRVRTACGRCDRRGGGCLFPRRLARQPRCRNVGTFGQPLAGAAASWCAVCSDRFGSLVQQLDPAARNRTPCCQGPA